MKTSRSRNFGSCICSNNPPPADIDPDHVAMARQFYLFGFGAMLTIAKRLHTESDERATIVLEALFAQLEKENPFRFKISIKGLDS